jgi:hypothetical protein
MTRRKMIKTFENENWVILVDKNDPGWANAIYKKPNCPMDAVLSDENVQRAIDECMPNGFNIKDKEESK